MIIVLEESPGEDYSRGSLPTEYDGGGDMVINHLWALVFE